MMATPSNATVTGDVVTPVAHAGVPAVASTTAVTPTAGHFSAAGALAQVGGALGAILLVILLGAWLVRKLGISPAGRGSRLLQVQASCSLGNRERVVIVQVEQTWLVLGVTAAQITALHSLPAPAVQNNEPGTPDAPDFRQRLLAQIKLRAGGAV